MKKLWFLSIIVMFFMGCESLQMTGDPNSPVVADPNTARQIVALGEGLQAIGTAIGHIELIGIGVGVIAIGSFLLKKKK